ncbi:hypothetical protein [uncultured Maricaulis sp.]|uniref:hypothetical protein n=1 Tax=uncultured Maricaulis sp. TaxID=174710 RepID=UPI0030DD802B|tara:strand:+ start:8743 stop:10485 length:1743 start_codon:yes stop_codon:yes gene_type:complete
MPSLSVSRAVLLAAAILLALVSGLLSLKGALIGYSPLPFWDQWDFVGNGEIWSRLFAQHNEHRIPLPRLFFMLDNTLFGGRNAFLLIVVFGTQLALWGGLVWVAMRAGLPLWDLVLAGGLVGALIVSPYQMENFYWGFQVQFVLVYFFGVMCIWQAVAAPHTLLGHGVVIALGLASAASLSAGLVALPSAALVAYFAGQSRLRVGLTAAAGLAVIALYFYGYHSPAGHSNPSDGLRHPIEVVYYALVYLGGPIGFALSRSVATELVPLLADPVQAAKLVGAFGAVCSIALLTLTYRRRPQPIVYVFAGVVVFIGLTAIMTALGRWEFGAPQALASRYATPVLLFWAALFLLGLTCRTDKASARLSAYQSGLTIGTAMAITGLLATEAGHGLDLARAQHDRMRNAETAVMTGVPDYERLMAVYPVPEHILAQGDHMRRLRLGVFRRPQMDWLGQSIDALGPIMADDLCLGSFDSQERLPGQRDGAGSGPVEFAIRASGWAWIDRAPARWLILTDSQRKVVGLGRTVVSRPDVMAAVPGVDALTTGWVAHGWVASGQQMQAYAVGVHGGLCALPPTEHFVTP